MLVPTMGALHEGHLSLVRLAREKADKVVVSIFVNPTQFAPHEDFKDYPRELERDRAKLADENVDLIYAPAPGVMYAPDASTRVQVEGLSEPLCGISRPHFFGGVATIVTKLLIQCEPDMAIFGEKDYQQLLVIRRMVRDLSLPVEICSGPIIREKNGLALSSRNAYLNKAQQRIAPALYLHMRKAVRMIKAGAAIPAVLEKTKKALSADGFDKIDYLEVHDAETLAMVTKSTRSPARLFAAVWLGQTRLIDNIAL
jgi:pantoate--beta-alanine ligase